MALLADGIGLRQPGAELQIHLLRLREAKNVDVIARGEAVDAAEPRRVEAPAKHEVPIEPATTGSQLCERHSGLKRNAGLFRQDPDRPEGDEAVDDAIEQGANVARLTAKMIGYRAEGPASMRLVAVREDATTATAAPERSIWSVLHEKPEVRLTP